MNRIVCRIAMLALVGAVSSAVSAAEIVDSKENHAFTVPAGWEDQHGKFGLWVHAEDVGSLSESKISSAPQSLEAGAERQAALFANANTTFKRIGAPVSLSGKNWNARVTPFQGTVNTILLMVAKDSRKYRVFFLTVRNGEYASNPEKYWDILRSWRSPASAK